MVCRELSQINSLMEMNSSRVNPDLAEFNENMEILKLSRRYERASILEMSNPRSIEIEKIELKGFTWHKNNDFFSKMLDLDPARHRVVNNDWQEETMIPKLKNKLDILSRCPGIYPTEAIAQYNPKKLTPFFAKLPQYSQINEQCIAPYFPPGSDVNLRRLASKHQAKYMMSTSTITSLLSQVYYTISNFKSPHFSGLSKAYDNEPLKFMVSQRKPNTVFLRQLKTEDKRELYAIDGDAGFGEASNTVLLKMGKYMEKMFTTDSDFFNDYFVLDLNTNKPRIDMTPEMMDDLREEDYFRYMMVGNMFLRSQIDCRGEDEEGNPIVFELKTRATAPLRYDIDNYIDFLDYNIIKCKGQHSSFEREFFDLVRGGFLKYIMQMKIGRMQGAAIAYHNTQKIFGFEYIKLEQMENRVFGCSEFSDVVFEKSLGLLEKIMDHILEDQYVQEEAEKRADGK